MIVPDAINLVSLPIAYYIGNLSGRPSYLIITVVGIEVLMCVLRTYYAVKVTELKTREIIVKVMYPSLSVVILTSIACFILSSVSAENLIGLLELLALNSIALCLIIYFVGISKEEKKQIQNIVRKKHAIMMTTVVVPISSGSKRVKDNDLRPFVDTTFWENKIKDFLKLPDKGLCPKLSTKLRKCFLKTIVPCAIVGSIVFGNKIRKIHNDICGLLIFEAVFCNCY